MIKSKKAIAAIFRKIADKIENSTCEVDDRELTEIANALVHRKLNAEQLSHHLGVSRSTITRMVTDGRIPHPRKTLGGDKYWWQDEVENHIAEYNEWKRKQAEEEKRLAEKYGMPYGEEVGDVQE